VHVGLLPFGLGRAVVTMMLYCFYRHHLLFYSVFADIHSSAVTSPPTRRTTAGLRWRTLTRHRAVFFRGARTVPALMAQLIARPSPARGAGAGRGSGRAGRGHGAQRRSVGCGSVAALWAAVRSVGALVLLSGIMRPSSLSSFFWLTLCQFLASIRSYFFSVSICAFRASFAIDQSFS